jgi:hypothetical protein
LTDGSTMQEFSIDKLKERLRDSPNDYERSLSMRAWGVAWLVANWRDVPRLATWRLRHFISQNGANGLTRVPRDRLFETTTSGYNRPLTTRASWLELFLVDKTPWVCFFALGGMLLLIVRYRLAGLVIASLCLTPWCVLALLVGYERMVESLISITVWLAVYFVAEMVVLLHGPTSDVKNQGTTAWVNSSSSVVAGRSVNFEPPLPRSFRA